MTNPLIYLRRDEAGESFEKAERILEPIMLGLSGLFVAVFGVPLLVDLSAESAAGLEVAGWWIWGAFVIEYVWLFWLAPDRMSWVRRHKLDALIIILPFLRPLRFLRVLRLATATSGLGRAVLSLRRIGTRPGFQPFFAAVAMVIFIGAAFVLVFEHGQPGASIDSFGTALWWAFVTCTTVGYGDLVPVTTAGRVVAIVLMVVGIAGLSLLTASVAALFVGQDDEDQIVEMQTRLERIELLLEQVAATQESQQVPRPNVLDQ